MPQATPGAAATGRSTVETR